MVVDDARWQRCPDECRAGRFQVGKETLMVVVVTIVVVVGSGGGVRSRAIAGICRCMAIVANFQVGQAELDQRSGPKGARRRRRRRRYA